MVNGKTMDRNAFLAQADVSDFIDWLSANLPCLDVHLHFSPSRFVPGGLIQNACGVQSVLLHYRWANSWVDYQTASLIQSDDWASTKISLDLLRDRLLSALANSCQDTTFKACKAILAWGGVRGAIPFLRRLQQQGELVNYLTSCQPLFSLTGSQNLSDLNSTSILRFDAGLTKIHALADMSGSPIYDSRVGAAIAMLYALYRQTASADPQLNFASGSARGMQIRDPGSLGFVRAPQFFTSAVTAPRWAQCQLELGWIIRETLTRSPLLFDDSSIDKRCHALEAALFMIGYDLRCLFPQGVMTSLPTSSKRKGKTAKLRERTWVPTSVPFVQVLQEYLNCSESAGHALELAEFRQWQIDIKLRKQDTAKAYCTPFKENEFDLPNFSIQDLRLIYKGGAEGLLALGETQFIAGDEREQVYLVDTFLTGRATQIATRYSLPANELLVQAGFAGKRSSANLILRMGKVVGQHFGLLSNSQPTAAFEAFFGNSLGDLEGQLRHVAEAISTTGKIFMGIDTE